MAAPKPVMTVSIVVPIGSTMGVVKPTVTNELVEPANAFDIDTVTAVTPPIGIGLTACTAAATEETDDSTVTAYEPIAGLAATGMTSWKRELFVIVAVVNVIFKTLDDESQVAPPATAATVLSDGNVKVVAQPAPQPIPLLIVCATIPPPKLATTT